MDAHAQGCAPGLKVVRVTDPAHAALPEAGRIVSEAFGRHFDEGLPQEDRIWRNGTTPALLEWRTNSLRRFVQLDKAGKRARCYVALRNREGVAGGSESATQDVEGHFLPDDVLGVACTYVTSKDDPYDKWYDIVPPYLPPPEDVNGELWAKTRDAFGAATQDHMGNDDAYQELVYLVVSPKVQRSGAGTALLKQVLADVAAERLRTFVITAPTPMAMPFYIKNGLEQLKHELLESPILPAMQRHDRRFGAVRYTPEGYGQK